MIRKSIFLCGLALLVVALSGCAARPTNAVLPTTAVPTTEASPTTILPVATDTPLSTPTTVVPTETTPAPTLPPATTAPPAPSNTPETLPTDTPLPPASPTPAGPVITPIQAGAAITITTIHMLDATHGWAVGGLAQQSDQVLSSADGGQTWRDVTPPQPAFTGTLQAAAGYFADASHAWVAYYPQQGRNVPPVALVWRTTDGGQTWQASAPLDLQGLNEFYIASELDFVDLENGWLLVHVGVGMNHDYVALYRTVDGGQTWSRLIDPYGTSGIQGCYKTGLVFTTPQIGWLTGSCNGVAPGAFLYQTSDGGENWQSVDLPDPAGTPDLFAGSGQGCGTRSAVFFSPQIGKLVVNCSDYTQNPVVNRNYLYTTQDGGASWTSAVCPTDTVQFLSPEMGWALGRDLSYTSDGGQAWTPVKSVNWDGQFSFVSDSLGWAVARATSSTGTLVALVQTSDGAQTWTEIHPTIAP